MTKDEAPERIWLWLDGGRRMVSYPNEPYPAQGSVQYTRTDLAEARVSELEAELNNAVAEAHATGVERERWKERADVADARLERAVRAALEAAADLAQDMDMGVGTNPYAWPERISEAIRAIDPARIVKGVKDE